MRLESRSESGLQIEAALILERIPALPFKARQYGRERGLLGQYFVRCPASSVKYYGPNVTDIRASASQGMPTPP